MWIRLSNFKQPYFQYNT